MTGWREEEMGREQRKMWDCYTSLHPSLSVGYDREGKGEEMGREQRNVWDRCTSLDPCLSVLGGVRGEELRNM